MPRGDRGGTSKGSGVRCVAANCGNTHADGVSMHFFPKDSKLRRIWTDFVQVKRADWGGPTEFSALCSFHFTSESFPFRHRFEIEHMGRTPKKVKLNEDAYPTIHCVNPVPASKNDAVKTDLSTLSTPKQKFSRLEMLSPSEEVAIQRSPPKKIRRGYLKREAARIVADYVNEQFKEAEMELEETTVRDSLY